MKHSPIELQLQKPPLRSSSGTLIPHSSFAIFSPLTPRHRPTPGPFAARRGERQIPSSKSEFARVKSMVPIDRLSPDAIDVAHVKEVLPDGSYYGELIVVEDSASLRKIPSGMGGPLRV